MSWRHTIMNLEQTGKFPNEKQIFNPEQIDRIEMNKSFYFVVTNTFYLKC